MKEVELPGGGTATFREPGVDEMPGRAVKLIKAATSAAYSQLAGYPEVFSRAPEDETPEQRAERLAPLENLRFTTEQAMAWDNMREAVVVATIKSWTLERHLPTLETIGDLPSDLYMALLNAVGGVSAADIELDLEATGSPKDEVPTGSSGSSNDGSTENQPSTQTPSSSSDNSASSGDDSSLEQSGITAPS